MSGRRSQRQPGGRPRGGKRPAGKGSGAKGRQGGGQRANTGQGPGAGRGGGSRRPPRKGLGGDQVEGRHAVRELLLAGRRAVHEVFMIEDLADADILTDIEELCQELGVSLRRVSRRHLGAEALTESHQGVVARAAPLAEADFDRLIADPAAFLVVLDGVTDPGNVGAILRTAECAGVTGLVVGRHRSARVSPTVAKTAAGAIEHVPIAMVGGIPTAVGALRDAGVLTVGLDEGGASPVFDLPGDRRPIALVLGAEGAGLSRLVRERVDLLASIPMAGQLNSLNVAMAAAVACFSVVRSRSGE